MRSKPYYATAKAINDVFGSITDFEDIYGVGRPRGGTLYRYRIEWQELCRLAGKYAGASDAHDWDVRAAAGLLETLGIPYSDVWVEVDDWGAWQVYWR